MSAEGSFSPRSRERKALTRAKMSKVAGRVPAQGDLLKTPAGGSSTDNSPVA
jgi:hypothetical protein